MYNIKWINKYSNESGYVHRVLKQKGYFENSFEQDKAKKYRYIPEAEREISYLNSIGEGDNNDFEIIEYIIIKEPEEKIKKDLEIEFILEDNNNNTHSCPICENRLKMIGDRYRCGNCEITLRKATINDLILKASLITEGDL